MQILSFITRMLLYLCILFVKLYTDVIVAYYYNKYSLALLYSLRFKYCFPYIPPILSIFNLYVYLANHTIPPL